MAILLNMADVNTKSAASSCNSRQYLDGDTHNNHHPAQKYSTVNYAAVSVIGKVISRNKNILV